MRNFSNPRVRDCSGILFRPSEKDTSEKPDPKGNAQKQNKIKPKKLKNIKTKTKLKKPIKTKIKPIKIFKI